MNCRRILMPLLMVLALGQALAQEQPDLDRLDEKFRAHLKTRMAGWTYKRGEPIEGSKGVLIQNWFYPNRGVRIAVTEMKSVEAARQALQLIVRDANGKPLQGLGDEAYIWGFEGSDLEVRRGRYVFDLNAGADVERDPDARTLTPAQKHTRQLAEVKRIIREFAKHAVDATDLP
jgi:hypothetical protein